MNFIPLHAVRFVILTTPFYFLVGCSGGDNGPATVNAQSTTTEQQILDKLSVLESKIDGMNFQGVTQNWDKAFPASSRFLVLADFNSEAVRDNETGLVWERQPNSQTWDWITARNNCATKAVGGRKGWRLPAMAELTSLVDPSASGITLPPGHPFLNVQSGLYWTATVSAENPSLAWNVDFRNGGVGIGQSFTDFYWCVRGQGQTSVY